MTRAIEGTRHFRPNDDQTGNVALLREIWEPITRGESDNKPFFDALADDVAFELPVGELRGKQAVVDYFAYAHETIEFQPFERPLEYLGAGDRVVILGDETFRVRETGVTHRAEWAWVHDLQDGLITRIVVIQDLAGVADAVRSAISKAQPGNEHAGRASAS
jgi:ketosteroid isomerase-like protein